MCARTNNSSFLLCVQTAPLWKPPTQRSEPLPSVLYRNGQDEFPGCSGSSGHSIRVHTARLTQLFCSFFTSSPPRRVSRPRLCGSWQPSSLLSVKWGQSHLYCNFGITPLRAMLVRDGRKERNAQAHTPWTSLCSWVALPGQLGN